jgi:hypothetical protein
MGRSMYGRDAARVYQACDKALKEGGAVARLLPAPPVHHRPPRRVWLRRTSAQPHLQHRPVRVNGAMANAGRGRRGANSAGQEQPTSKG